MKRYLIVNAERIAKCTSADAGKYCTDTDESTLKHPQKCLNHKIFLDLHLFFFLIFYFPILFSPPPHSTTVKPTRSKPSKH